MHLGTVDLTVHPCHAVMEVDVEKAVPFTYLNDRTSSKQTKVVFTEVQNEPLVTSIDEIVKKPFTSGHAKFNFKRKDLVTSHCQVIDQCLENGALEELVVHCEVDDLKELPPRLAIADHWEQMLSPKLLRRCQVLLPSLAALIDEYVIT